MDDSQNNDRGGNEPSVSNEEHPAEPEGSYYYDDSTGYDLYDEDDDREDEGVSDGQAKLNK